MKNYFLVYRPFHAEYALQIAQQHLGSEEVVLVNHTAVRYPQPPSGTVRTVNFEQGLFARMKAIRAVKNEIVADLKSGKDVNVSIPHTLGLLANYCYYRLAPRYRNLKMTVFYEGVIVFYDYRHGYLKNYKHYLSRFITGLLCGMPFTINKHLLDFKDQRITKIYSPFLSINAPESKLVKATLGEIVYVPRQDTCVILGLKLATRFDPEMERIIGKMYETASELGANTVFFKDHPYERNELFQKVAHHKGIQLEEIKDPEPIEKIIDHYRPAFVFSVWSSGLINLRAMLPSDVRIFSVVGREIVKSHNLESLLKVFGENKIEVIWV